MKVEQSEQPYDLHELTKMFRLLSDRTRLTILVMLAGGEKNVSTLCASLKLPQPTVSHHLGLLRSSKVIVNRRAGKQVFYGLNGQFDRQQSELKILLEKHEVRISPTPVTQPITLAS